MNIQANTGDGVMAPSTRPRTAESVLRCGRAGAAVFEGQREAGPDQLHAVLPLAHPGTYVALLAEDARLEVDPPRLARLPAGRFQQAERGPEARRRAQVPGGHEACPHPRGRRPHANVSEDPPREARAEFGYLDLHRGILRDLALALR